MGLSSRTENIITYLSQSHTDDNDETNVPTRNAKYYDVVPVDKLRFFLSTGYTDGKRIYAKLKNYGISKFRFDELEKGSRSTIKELLSTSEMVRLDVLFVLDKQEKERVKCKCPCHNNGQKDIKHAVPCCENGYIELPRYLFTK